MIDSLVAMRPRIESFAALEAHGLERGTYLVVTLHRHRVDGQFLADDAARAGGGRRGCRSCSRSIRAPGRPWLPRHRGRLGAAASARSASGTRRVHEPRLRLGRRAGPTRRVFRRRRRSPRLPGFAPVPARSGR
jgi:hypothetical protein